MNDIIYNKSGLADGAVSETRDLLSMEKEKLNAISTLAETVSELSLASQIPEYVPTQWIDNSEPSINAARLLHIENGIKKATDAVNKNIDSINAINTSLEAKLNASGGDAANTKVSAFTASTAQYPIPAGGDSLKVICGKIVKFFNDVKSGMCKVGDIINNCTSTDTNKPLAANQGKILMDKYTQLDNKKTNTIAVLTVNSGSVIIPANSTKEITKTFTPWGGFDVFCLLYTNINGNTGLSVNSATVDGTNKTCGAWINNHNSSSSTVNIDWGILMVAK